MDDRRILELIEAATVKVVKYGTPNREDRIAYHFEDEQAMIKAVKACLEEAVGDAYVNGVLDGRLEGYDEGYISAQDERSYHAS